MTVDQAVMEERGVQIKTVEDETYLYKKLIIRDSILYGVKRVSGVGLMEQDLTHLNIIEVKYYSQGKAVAIIVVSVVGVIFIIGKIMIEIHGININI